MRYISNSLKRKLDKRYQTKAQNADPKMEIHIGKGLGRSVFNTFTIKEGGGNGFSDLAISKSNDNDVPSRVYVSHLLNNRVTILSKELPYNDEIPWTEEFKLKEVISDSAIDFNGFWEQDTLSEKYNLITGEYPYIFFISNNNLYYQYWKDSKQLLVRNAERMAVIRGWIPAVASHTDDQGLIVAYIRDGKVYYRNYCLNIAGTYSWEAEREVQGLPSNCVDIHLSRTNDFRVAFTVQTTNNEIHYALTRRNWAGMSIYPESIVSYVGNVSLGFKKISFKNTSNIERIDTRVSRADLQYCPFDYVEMELLSVNKIDDRTIKLTFNDFIDNTNVNDLFSVNGYSINITKLDKTLTIKSDVNFEGNISLVNNKNIKYVVNEYCKLEMDILTDIEVSFNRFINTLNTENISVGVSNVELDCVLINFTDVKYAENISTKVLDVDLQLIHIDDVVT